MGKHILSDRTLSLGDEEIPILFDGLYITKDQAASLTDEEMKTLMQRWGEDLDMNTSQEPEPDPSGYVYLAKGTKIDGGPIYKGRPLYKIGRSNEPKDRVRTFDTKMPMDTEIINHIPANDSNRSENILHARHDAVRVKGEWFDLDDISVAELAHATGFENGELTFTHEALRDYMEVVLQVLARDDKLLDEMVKDLSSHALSAYMKCSALNGPDGLYQKMEDRVVAEKRVEALALFIYWFVIDSRSSPPEEWDTSPWRVVEAVLFVLSYHPDLNHTDTDDDRMESLAVALFRRCHAASEPMNEIVGDVTGSQEEAVELISYLMPHHPEVEAHYEERNDESKE